MIKQDNDTKYDELLEFLQLSKEDFWDQYGHMDFPVIVDIFFGNATRRAKRTGGHLISAKVRQVSDNNIPLSLCSGSVIFKSLEEDKPTKEELLDALVYDYMCFIERVGTLDKNKLPVAIPSLLKEEWVNLYKEGLPVTDKEVMEAVRDKLSDTGEDLQCL